MSGRRSTTKVLLDAAVGPIAVGLFHAVRSVDRRRGANFAAAMMRRAGPLLPEHRVGRDNLRSAFPQKSDAEIEKILAGVWDNLGRVAAEFAHLEEFELTGTGPSTRGHICYDPATAERYQRIIGTRRPTIQFAAHLANWEIPALAGKLVGVNSAVLYRRLSITAISDLIVKLRANVMGQLVPTGLDAPVRLARLLQDGYHVGMLVDQHFTKGVEVTFFGRSCKANPLIALLARQTELPIHGIRVVREPDGDSFRCEVTEAIDPPRDRDGRVDIRGTMQAITDVIERWVREHPEQWLWLHRRWR